MAERTVDQALVFLAACAQNRGGPLAPSAQVDVGWHTFILFTLEYAEFCQRIAGRFLHHVPDDISVNSEAVLKGDRMVDTFVALEATGLRIDHELWAHPTDCNQCYNGCQDSPKK